MIIFQFKERVHPEAIIEMHRLIAEQLDDGFAVVDDSVEVINTDCMDGEFMVGDLEWAVLYPANTAVEFTRLAMTAERNLFTSAVQSKTNTAIHTHGNVSAKRYTTEIIMSAAIAYRKDA